MEIDNKEEQEKYLRAKGRVDEIKKYYTHLVVYIVVNTFISINKIMRNMSNGETFSEAFFDFNTFAVWVFWGIGIAFHTFKVFGFNLILGKNWEERKIKKYMDEQ